MRFKYLGYLVLLFAAALLITIFFGVNRQDANYGAGSVTAGQEGAASHVLKNNKEPASNESTTFAEMAPLHNAARRQELFDYSRSGNYPDTRKRLKDALKAHVISSKEYYGELAHMLSISVDDALGIIKEIVNSKNSYGYEVMTASLDGNTSLAESMVVNERREIFTILINNKSELSGHVSEMGLVDMFRYESWLGAIRAFAKDDAEYYKFVSDLLEDGIEDPREVFGIKYSMTDSEISRLSPAAKKNYDFYINAYLRSYPANKVAAYVNNRGND